MQIITAGEIYRHIIHMVYLKHISQTKVCVCVYVYAKAIKKF